MWPAGLHEPGHARPILGAIAVSLIRAHERGLWKHRGVAGGAVVSTISQDWLRNAGEVNSFDHHGGIYEQGLINRKCSYK